MRYLSLILAALLCSCALAGCGVKVHKTTDEMINETISGCVFDDGDKFDKGRSVLFSGYDKDILRALAYTPLDKQFGFLVNFYNDRWVFYDRCNDDQGNELKAKRTDSEVSKRGGVSEEITGLLTESYLRSKASTGFQIKCYGKRGSTVIDFPATHVQGFLQCVAKAKQK